MKRFGNKIKAYFYEYKLVLKCLPPILTIGFIVAVILMNLMANKLIFQYGWLAADAGFLVSWLPFLTMDIVTKRFGPRAANKLNIIGLLVNLFCIGMLALSALFPGENYDSFNYLFGITGNWFIWLASATAFLISGLVNNFSNFMIGQIFKKNPNSKLAFVTRTYFSTLIGQFVDNFIFAFVAYWIFGNYFWGGAFFVGGSDFSFRLIQCLGSGILGALLELLLEIIFSPLGYRWLQKMQKNHTGQEYLDYIAQKEEVKKYESLN